MAFSAMLLSISRRPSATNLDRASRRLMAYRNASASVDFADSLVTVASAQSKKASRRGAASRRSSTRSDRSKTRSLHLRLLIRRTLLIGACRGVNLGPHGYAPCPVELGAAPQTRVRRLPAMMAGALPAKMAPFDFGLCASLRTGTSSVKAAPASADRWQWKRTQVDAQHLSHIET